MVAGVRYQVSGVKCHISLYFEEEETTRALREMHPKWGYKPINTKNTNDPVVKKVASV